MTDKEFSELARPMFFQKPTSDQPLEDPLSAEAEPLNDSGSSLVEESSPRNIQYADLDLRSLIQSVTVETEAYIKNASDKMHKLKKRPSHPPSAYLIFSLRLRQKLSSEGVKAKDSYAIVKRRWKTFEGKGEFQALAKAIYKEYKLLLQEWEQVRATLGEVAEAPESVSSASSSMAQHLPALGRHLQYKMPRLAQNQIREWPSNDSNENLLSADPKALLIKIGYHSLLPRKLTSSSEGSEVSRSISISSSLERIKVHQYGQRSQILNNQQSNLPLSGFKTLKILTAPVPTRPSLGKRLAPVASPLPEEALRRNQAMPPPGGVAWMNILAAKFAEI